jgi:HAD superfamily hydrolase (TIGR01509 family)
MIAIGFDFDHTLGVDNALERKAMYAYAAELGHPLDPADDDLRKGVEALLASFRGGEITMDQMLARFARRLGVPADVLRAERWREICYELVPELVRPLDGARDTITTLRTKQIPIAILTNGWTPLQQKKIAHALGADIAATLTILVSDAIRAIKPDPAAFAALADTLRTPRDRTWYVGDNPRGDVAGALAAGLRAVWFDWEGLSYPHDVPPPTLRIASLRELVMLAENTIAP